MKTTYYLVLFVLFTFILGGCAQTKISTPPSQEGSKYGEPQPIPNTMGMDDSDRRIDQTKTGPQPIAKPVVDQTALSADGDQKPSQLTLGYINGRILEYGKKLELWKERDAQSAVATLDQQQTQIMIDCFRDLQRLVSGYQEMRDQFLQNATNSSMNSIKPDHVISIQMEDISFLEGRCGSLLDSPEDLGSGLSQISTTSNQGQIESVIAELYQNKAYQELAQFWSEIPSYQLERVEEQSKIRYANALRYLDRPSESAEVYQSVVDEKAVSADQPTDMLSLRRMLADLYTASGNFFAAEGQYELISSDYQAIGAEEQWSRFQLSMLEKSMKGSPELTDYSELIRSYLRFFPEKDGYSVAWKAETFLQQYPYSPVSSNVDIIKEQTVLKADEWFQASISQSELLISEKRFEEGLNVLQKIPEQNLDPDKLQVLKERIDELILKEAVDRETIKIEKMQGLQASWNEAMTLADSSDFDGAIAVLTPLLDTEYDARAEEKIAELSLTAAKIERRKAADLFVRFSKSADPQAQKDLLIESRQVLKDILIKYPEVEVGDKVMGNIKMVEKKMNELDPMLLPALEQKEQEQAELDRAGDDVELKVEGFDMDFSTSQQPAEPRPAEPLPVLTPQALQ